jgi:F-type H+-transporting ATPase subunit b
MPTAALTHVAASSGSFLITPNVGLMIWTLVLFVLSMVVLARLAFPRIQEALDRRQHAIEESIEHAERIRKEADELLDEYRERLKDARSQAEEIIARSRKSAEAHEHDSLEKAQQTREQLMEQTRKEIELETRRAISEIRSEVADLTVLATEKVTRKTLTEEDQQRLVQEALADLDFSVLAGNGSSAN